ncbi:MAG: RDD family protein [Verrucomicrobiota bacterium]
MNHRRSMENEKLKAAGFGMRFVAKFIDMIIVMIVLTPISIFVMIKVYGLEMLMDPTRQDELVYPWWVDVGLTLVFLVLVIFIWKLMKGTPGKRLLGLRIVDARTGEDPPMWRLSLRSLGYILSMMPIIPIRYDVGWGWLLIPVGLGFFWVLISKKNYGWHDMISGAIVVQTSDLPQSAAAKPQ